MKRILLLILIWSNLAWAYAYKKLWLDDAQANAWLDWASEYMKDMGAHERAMVDLAKTGDGYVVIRDGMFETYDKDGNLRKIEARY